MGDWRAVCADLCNQVQILISLGKLEQALEVSDRGIIAAKHIDDEYQLDSYYAGLDSNWLYVSALVRKATVLHRMNRLEESMHLFEEAERRHGGYLARVNGYYYELFLLDTARDEPALRVVIRRGEQNLKLARERKSLGDAGYHHAIIGSTYVALNETQLARTHLDSAVELLQRANRADRIPHALIQRAHLMHQLWIRDHDDIDRNQCEADIGEAERLIVLANMSLFRIDLHLLRARIFIDTGKFEEAHKLIHNSLEPSIQSIGYALRAKDLQALNQVITSQRGR